MMLSIAAWSLATGLLLGPPVGDSSSVRWHFVPGETLRYRVTEEQVIDDEAEGVPEIRTKTVSTLVWQPISVEEIGSRHRVRFERIELDLNTGKEKARLDTTQPAARREPREFALFRSLSASEFMVTLNDEQGIVSLAGGPPNEQERIASQAHLRRIWAVLGSWVPPVGASLTAGWQRREELPAGLVELSRTSTVRMVGQEGSLMRFRSTHQLVGKPTKSPGNEGETIVASLSQSEPGTADIVFDLDRGVVRSIDSSARFRMLVTRVSDGPPRAAAQSAQRASARLQVELLAPPAAGRAN